MTADIINGFLEFTGGLFLLGNVIKLAKDKQVRGVHWLPTLFFAVWGFWNLYYYPHLDQWASFFGGVFIVTINTYWFVQMLYYRDR